MAHLTRLTRVPMRFSRSQASREGPYGIRTRAAAVRGRCPRPLDEWAVVARGQCSGLADPGEPLDGGQQLLALLRCGLLVARLEGVLHAVPDVLVEDLQRDALEGLGDRADLGEPVHAVAVVLDHLLDPADLALDAAQALAERFLVVAVAVVGHVRTLLNRRRRREFVTTKIDENAIAAAATIGLSRPATASGIAATL